MRRRRLRLLSDADRKQICRRFGERVRALRLARGWTQDELSGATGLHYNYIGSIERGEVNIGLANLSRLMVALGVGVGELLDEGIE